MKHDEARRQSRARRLFTALVRAPLLHFLVLGGILFGLYPLVSGKPLVGHEDRIVVDAGQVEHLSARFKRTWMRPPTPEELENLVQEHVKVEILYREALAWGLDKDDPVIRQRLRQKMEFLNTDLTEPRPPTESELRDHLHAHMERFRSAPRVSFLQVYLNRDAGHGPAYRRASALLNEVSGRAPSVRAIQQLGDATLLPSQMQGVDEREVAGLFGEGLAKAIAAAPLGRWSGPYESAYGLHLVYISDRIPAREPPLEEVRPAVTREWMAERQQQANERFYEALRKRYTVEVELPTTDRGSRRETPQ